jgi:prohibitin 1
LILDLQTINITLRILYRPQAEFLPRIFSTLGLDYEERVLPSITNEVLKSVVVSHRSLFIVLFIVEFMIRLNSMP